MGYPKTHVRLASPHIDDLNKEETPDNITNQEDIIGSRIKTE